GSTVTVVVTVLKYRGNLFKNFSTENLYACSVERCNGKICLINSETLRHFDSKYMNFTGKMLALCLLYRFASTTKQKEYVYENQNNVGSDGCVLWS
ncbi:MAG TPA: hypothetical protein VN132_14020, partial [Bdellovibrio sp.]|nr:hypothetical protein [Bdellovibrio sp.]